MNFAGAAFEQNVEVVEARLTRQHVLAHLQTRHFELGNADATVAMPIAEQDEVSFHRAVAQIDGDDRFALDQIKRREPPACRVAQARHSGPWS